MRRASLLGAVLAAAAVSAPPSDPGLTRKPTNSNLDRLLTRTDSARSRRGGRWRPFGERHADLDFTELDRAALDRAAAKRERKAQRRRGGGR